MRRKHKHREDNGWCHERLAKPITMEEANALTCGKMFYQFHFLYDQEDNIIGKTLIFMENFYETGQPEEAATKWSILVFDDGRLMISEW